MGSPAEFEYRRDWSLEQDTSPLPSSAHPVHYHSRLLSLVRTGMNNPELLVRLPPTLQVCEEADGTFAPLVVHLEFSLASPQLGIRFLDTQQYFQIAGDSEACRYWMPCMDGERCTWDLEYAVSTASVSPLDKLHVVSSGVMCQQFVKESFKIFHYKLDVPMPSNRISFAAGLFDMLKIHSAPFAYAFCPATMSAKLAVSVEFLSRAFGFVNWFLSTLFPFPSFYLVFLRDAPCDLASAANVAFCSSALLHDQTIIDQTWETRSLLAKALCEQYFRIRLGYRSTADCWLMKGLVGYLTGQLLRVFHGQNDYRLQVRHDIERVCELEPSQSHSLCDANVVECEWLELKSRLIFVLLEQKLEKALLQKVFMHLWSETCQDRLSTGLSTHHFLRVVKRMTGKDVSVFADQWIFGLGCPVFTCSFSYNRKKSVIEVDLRQSTPGHPAKKFVGSLLIRVHEVDGVNDHSVHIDDFLHHLELPFHSKIKKARKPDRRKSKVASAIPDSDPDESLEPRDHVEEDDATVVQSLISWIRLDPNMEWLATCSLHQPDFMWIEQLEQDRNVVAQYEAIGHLSSSPSEASLFALERVLVDPKCFYKVRMEAALAFSRAGSLGLARLLDVFSRRFGQGIVPLPNKFDNLPNYFVKKAIVQSVGMVRDEQGQCPSQAIGFLLDLIKYNDNSQNPLCDNYYLATIIRAITEAVESRRDNDPDVLSRVVAGLERYIRLEQMCPSYKNTIMVAIIEAFGRLFSKDLTPYLEPGHYVDIRLKAFEVTEPNEHYFQLGLQLIASDDLLRFQEGVIAILKARLSASMEWTQKESVKNSLWNALRAIKCPSLVLGLLQLCKILYEGAPEDLPAPKEEGHVLPAVAPVRVVLNMHELSSSDEEQAGPVQPTADWLAEISGDPLAKAAVPPKRVVARPIPKLRLPYTGKVDEKERMLKSFRTIWDSYDSFAFRYPVDKSVPGYYDIIKTPMDLSTIQLKITRGLYPNVGALCADLFLIFDNCFIFNQPDSLICDQAKRLRAFALKELKREFSSEAKAIKRILTKKRQIRLKFSVLPSSLSTF